ncbi:hypothetical protein LTR08_006688 [Meristemomyces frigidus]|nr:hypothetical protein LTR08_006688 [Meristemomyces frigidus]
MAPTGSPRDHDADANPDLSRKRARLSEEADSPASDDVREIEILPPNFIGADPIHAIAIDDDDDDDIMSGLYSETFVVFPGMEAVEQVQEFHNKILDTDKYLEVIWYTDTADWLEEHIETTADESRDTWLHGYGRDDIFFGEFASMMWDFLQADTMFAASDLYKNPGARDRLPFFMLNLMKLSLRFISLAPDITKEQLARRDSAQVPPKPREQEIPALQYIRLARLLLTLNDHNAKYLRAGMDLKLKATKEACRGLISNDGETARALVAVLRDICQHVREVKDAWHYIQAVLVIARCEVFHRADAEAVLDITNQSILPAVREKHPRALPEGFHGAVVKGCGDVVGLLGADLDFEQGWQLYERVIKGDHDALLSEGEKGPERLGQVCNGDPDEILPLLRAAWVLQAYKAFIFSSIMDIRSCGITLLSQELTEWFRVYCGSTSGSVDHPVIQYAARFLRSNSLTEYIFSANSHASIVNHSKDIIGFLAATFTYTDQETDIIWQACTTSVETDFVKASFAVLQDVSRHLGFEQLRHAIQRYSTTPVGSTSSQDAYDTLASLIVCLHQTMPPGDAEAQLVPALLGLELLTHVQTQERTLVTEQLVTLAMREISTVYTLPTEARLHILRRCVPDIVNKTASATSALLAVVLFLKHGVSAAETAQLLEILPINAVVDELRHFVLRTANAGGPDWDSHLAALRCRVDVVVRMLSLVLTEMPYQNHHNEDVLFQCVLGGQAFNNHARDIGWSELSVLSKSESPPPAASHLLHRYLNELLPSLASEHVTPALIRLLVEHLQGTIARTTQDESSYLHALSLPSWQQIARYAAEVQQPGTAMIATKAVCEVLFTWPKGFDDKAAIVRCHVEFVRSFVDRLCHDYADPTRFVEEDEMRKFRQAINVLETVLDQSRQTQISYQLREPSRPIIIDAANKDAEPFGFSVQICSPENRQALIEIQASKSTTVAELTRALPARTGTAQSKVIVSGKPIDLVADGSRTLCEAGVQASGVIMIYPTYTPSLDLDQVLTGSGPVEQELQAHRARLEVFLDGPTYVAQSAHRLLSALKPAARFPTATTPAAAAELLPPDRPYRALYSLHLLQNSLQVYARFAVADEEFILRGVHMLTEFLLNESYTFSPALFEQVAHRLLLFLLGKRKSQTQNLEKCRPANADLEKPCDAVSSRYFDDPARFAVRIMELISRTMSIPFQPAPASSALPLRANLALILFKVGLQACRIDEHVWATFMDDAQSASLHARMLLDSDNNLSRDISSCIENFCIESSAPADRVERYWQIVMGASVHAFERPFAVTAYFNLATELLNRNQEFQSDEQKVRNLVQELLAQLRNYNHTETPSFPFADKVMVGLLQLLSGAITVLKSFKKPLRLGPLPVELMDRLLFPLPGVPGQPLLNEESRGAVFDIVKATCESMDDYRSLAHTVCHAIRQLPPDPKSSFPGVEGWIRPPTQCAGLVNLGMTCYMNSLLQQLYANLSFRKFIFDTPVVDAEKQSFLLLVQDLFARMQDGPIGWADTTGLARFLDVQIQTQEDVHSFYATFLSRLEEAMPDGEYRKTFSNFYTGKFVSQVKGSCGHVSTKSEPFTDVAITVKNKASLTDSLDEFVQGEPMQGANRYRCHTCNKQDGLLVDAMKRTCLDEVPDNLTFCLKRFTWESMMGLEGKVNDRFEFPLQVDMARYERPHVEQPEQPVEPDVFELVGIIVHQGSLEYGHYWSYTRLAGSSRWVRLEDQNVQFCGSIEEVQHHCFGGLTFSNGQEKTDNGYVLFYQRRSQILEQAQLITPVCESSAAIQLLPPKVQAPAGLAEKIYTDSIWRHKVANLFAPQFSAFVEWLISAYPASDTSVSDGNALVDSPRTDDAESPAAVAATYLLRVVLTDVASQKRLQTCTHAITSAFDKHGTVFAKRILQAMVEEPTFCAAIWRHTFPDYRTAASELIEKCLLRLKGSGDESYMELLRQIIGIHSSSYLAELDSIYVQWPEYFRFPATLARFGPTETAIVLDGGYLETVLKVLYLKWMDDNFKRQHSFLWNMTKNERIDTSALFWFLHSILSDHVELGVESLGPHGAPRLISDGLVHLSHTEWHLLTATADADKANIWLLAYIGCQSCPVTQGSATFAPALLVGLLAGPRTEPTLVREIERALVDRFETEQYHLKPMLYITLHFINSRGDSESREILRQLSRNLTLWPKLEGEILDFCTAAAISAPGSMVESCSNWAFAFLQLPNPRVRARTRSWLASHLFADAQAAAQHTASRIRAARTLASLCLPFLKNQYDQEASKVRFEDMFETMAQELAWLTAVHDEIRSILGDKENKARRRLLSQEVRVEYDESRTTLKALKHMLTELSEWESDPLALPGVAFEHSARSVGIVDDDEIHDSERDADVEDDDYDGSTDFDEELEAGPA